jgi:hypothetical protein
MEWWQAFAIIIPVVTVAIALGVVAISESLRKVESLNFKPRFLCPHCNRYYETSIPISVMSNNHDFEHLASLVLL